MDDKIKKMMESKEQWKIVCRQLPKAKCGRSTGGSGARYVSVNLENLEEQPYNVSLLNRVQK